MTGRTDRHRSGGGAQAYQQYIKHLWDTQDKAATSEEATRGYEDYLQAPLQVPRALPVASRCARTRRTLTPSAVAAIPRPSCVDRPVSL